MLPTPAPFPPAAACDAALLLAPGERVCISVVSHQQLALVKNLLDDLARHCRETVEVILTLNVDEPLPFGTGDFGYPLEVVRNAAPRGFGANHNAAFGLCRRKTFCVLNPDIVLTADPFPALLAELARGRVGVVAPRIVNAEGHTEDNARRFPTLWSLGAKALRRTRRLDYEIGTAALSPDWVAGMFMLFTAEAFRTVAGFDENYYLYYEDVDICARLRAAGYDVRLAPGALAVHHARRASHHRWLHRAWHLKSIMRYFLTRGRSAAR
ncbi:MAG: glycosyltransferase family 2 protein [Burkholderiales bacterium]